MENKSKPRKMKELIRIEDFNPEHVNGLFNQFECEVIKSGKGYYFKLTIKEQVSSTSDYPLELKFALSIGEAENLALYLLNKTKEISTNLTDLEKEEDHYLDLKNR
jgi:hypothetical protein